MADERQEFEDWMLNEAKVIIGSTDPYPAGLERDYWRVWQAARRRAAPSSPVGDDGLPELPEPTSLGWNAATADVYGYTADQVRQAQREAVEADRRAREGAGAAENCRSSEKVQVAQVVQEQPVPGDSVDTEALRRLAENWSNAATECNPEKVLDCWVAIITHINTWAARRAAGSTAGWTSVDERLPPVGQPVLVYSPPTKYDHPGDVSIGFDCIDPNDDDHASWLNHNEHYEHFCCVGKPEGSIGPSADAPYTHWMPMPAIPQQPQGPE